MILQYKCPGCGSDMNFDPHSGELSCPSCGRHEKVESNPEEFNPPPISEEETAEYHCGNCGAVLITTAETAATSCSFCSSPVVIAERVTGRLAPHKVIPFTISKADAAAAFQKWCRKGLLTPKAFRSADRIKSMTGIYVPFWLYDLNSRVQVQAECTKVRTYTQGDYDYTETNYYDAFRDINLEYLKIPVDASEKMNDELMDKLEPFPYEQLKDFNTPYLAGFMAEKYNYTDDELFPRAKDKISNYIESYIQSTLVGYHSVSYRNKDIDTRKLNSDYVLLPVWMVSYDYHQKEYVFAMNGQTGKIVGKPPISGGRVAGWFSGIAAGTFVALKIVALLMGGGLW